MAKFCGNCGSQASDDANVCGVCGTVFETLESTIAEVSDASPEVIQKRKFIALGAIGVAALVIIIAVVISIVSATGGYKGAVRKIMNAYMDGDVDALVRMSSCIYDDNEYHEDTLDSQVDYTLIYFEDELGSKYKWSYEIKKDSVLSKCKFEKRIENLEEYYDVDKRDISKIAEVDVKVTAKAGKDKETRKFELVLSKEKGGWKLLSIN